MKLIFLKFSGVAYTTNLPHLQEQTIDHGSYILTSSSPPPQKKKKKKKNGLWVSRSRIFFKNIEDDNTTHRAGDGTGGLSSLVVRGDGAGRGERKT